MAIKCDNQDCEYRHRVWKICVLNDSEYLDCCPLIGYNKLKQKGN